MSVDTEHALLIRMSVEAFQNTGHMVSDVVALEKELAASLGNRGEVDGHEFGLAVGGSTQLQEATIFIYGGNADTMFAAIEPVLKGHVQLAGAMVTLRFGPPGSAERLVEISP